MIGRIDDVRFLVLDDHHNMCMLWRTILHAFGVKVIHEAHDAAEAFEILQSTAIDIAIIDYQLEDLSGAEFTQMLRSSKDSPNRMLPIVACTAHTQSKIVKELRDSGVDEVLAKPVSIQMAWDKIRHVIEARREFVQAPKFSGPDRRRREKEVEAEKDRRQSA